MLIWYEIKVFHDALQTLIISCLAETNRKYHLRVYF